MYDPADNLRGRRTALRMMERGLTPDRIISVCTDKALRAWAPRASCILYATAEWAKNNL